ncbi:hypothetical protein K2X33_01715 [bacterium]|nr:hypothetical protein [bacterium]
MKNTVFFSLVMLSSIALGAGEKRLSLVSMGVEGYDAFAPIRSYLDIGVARKEAACEILSPRAGTKAASRPWLPFDFYTNIHDDAERTKAQNAGTVGEADIFWVGDNGNRNAGNANHDATREVTAAFLGSLEFQQCRRQTDRFSCLLAFTRGSVVFKTLISVVAWPKEDGCTAAAFQCTKPYENEGTTHCQPDGWTRKIHEVVALASLTGAASDKFWRVTDEKKKTDVSSVEAVFQNYDTATQAEGDRYREHVSP